LFSSTMFLCSASLFFFLYFFISSLGLFFMGSHIWFIFGGKTTMLQDIEVWCWSWEFAQARSRAWKGLKICIIIWFYKKSKGYDYCGKDIQIFANYYLLNISLVLL
jgi:hypothetical protein